MVVMRVETISVCRIKDTSLLRDTNVKRTVVPNNADMMAIGGAPVATTSFAVGVAHVFSSARDFAGFRSRRKRRGEPKTKAATATPHALLAIDANTGQRRGASNGHQARSRADIGQRRAIVREARAVGHAPSLMNSCHGMPVTLSSFIAVGFDAPLTPRRMREIWEREGLPLTSFASSTSVEPRFSIHDCNRVIGEMCTRCTGKIKGLHAKMCI